MSLPFRCWFGRPLLLALVGFLSAISTEARGQDAECDPGEKEVRQLHFEGNRAFSDADLSIRVATTASSVGRRYLRVFGTKRCLDPSGLANDVERLRLVYEAEGYYDTTVDTLVRTLKRCASPSPGPRSTCREEIAVTFRVNEGLPLRVDSLTITGLDLVPNRAEITRDLKLAPGNRFGLARLSADFDSITSRLRNTGYPYVSMGKNFDTHPAEHRAEVALDVNTGPRVKFGGLQVDAAPAPGKPTAQIDTAVVRRLAGISPGTLYSDRVVTTARRNLLQTAAYVHVDVIPLLDSVPSPADTIVPVVARVREDLMRQVDGEFGWATLDCFRTVATYTDKNFLSDARRFEVSGRFSKLGWGTPTGSELTRQACWHRLAEDNIASKVVNYSVSATLHQPVVAGHWNPALSVYRERRGEYEAYLRTTIIGGEASTTRDIRSNVSLRGAYAFEYGSTSAEPALLCFIFLRCDDESRKQVLKTLPLAIASAAIQRRTTDNSIDPRQGTVLRLEGRASARAIGSDDSLSFLKSTVDAAWYRALAPRTVLAVRFRGGAITTGRLPPPQERLYAGGANSVRGYQQNQLGELIYLVGTNDIDSLATDSTRLFYIKNEGTGVTPRPIPAGGNSLVVTNVDLRLRDPFFPNLLQYTVFTDVGALWTRRAGKANLTFDQFKYTPGIGVRYFSPVGPIQVNVGYNPYGRPAGAAFYAPPKSGDFAPLYCVSTNVNTAIPVRKDNAGRWVQDQATCGDTFKPSQSNIFFRRLTFTISIGPDF